MSLKKLVYTKEEITKMTPEEIQELTTFKGTKGTFPFADLDYVYINKKSDSYISFKNGRKLYSEDLEALKKIEDNKSRYEMSFKNFNEVQSDSVYIELVGKKFNDQISEILDKQMKIVEENNRFITAQQATINESIEHMKRNIDISHDTIMNNISNHDGVLEKAIDKSLTKVTKLIGGFEGKIDNLTNIDKELVVKKMAQLDEIISAFDSLLEE